LFIFFQYYILKVKVTIALYNEKVGGFDGWQKFIVAYDGSPDSKKALAMAVDLAIMLRLKFY